MSQLTDDLKLLQQHYFKEPLHEDTVHLLSKGYSGARNYRLQFAGKTYFARLMPDFQTLSSREGECLITDHVGKIGVGASVYYQNPQAGILITEFIEGRTANYADMTNDPNRGLIIANLKKLHQTNTLNFPKTRNIAKRIDASIKHFNLITLQKLFQELDLIEPLNKLIQCEEKNYTPALIHGDFNPNNILISDNNRIYFIDWTDAGIGDPFADIAWHAILYPVDQANSLLHNYFDQVTDFLQQKLICFYCLRLYLRATWGSEQMKNFSINNEPLLADTIKQANLPTPYSILKDVINNKIDTTDPNIYLTYTASNLRYLTQITKSDIFLTSAKELISHA